MKLFIQLTMTMCFCALSLAQGLDGIGTFSFTSSNLDDVFRFMNATAEQQNEESFKTDKPAEEFEPSHLHILRDDEKKDSDTSLKPEADTGKGLHDTGNTDEFKASPSKPSTNETEIVYMEDDDNVKKAENELEKNLEEFEEFEEGVSNSSNLNDTMKIVITPTKEVMKKTDIEDTKSFVGNSFENESKAFPSKPSTNETEIVYMEDDDNVKKAGNELGKNLEEFEEFEAGVSNSSKSNDTRKIVITQNKEVMKKNDIEDTESFVEKDFENDNEDDLFDPLLNPVVVSFSTTETYINVLDPVLPEPRSIPMDDSNAVKEVETSNVPETEVSTRPTESSVAKFTAPRSQEPRSYPVGDSDAAKDAESPNVLKAEVFDKPTESSVNRFTSSKPNLVSPTPILEADLDAESIQHNNIKHPSSLSDDDLKIGTAKIDSETDGTSSTNSSTIQADQNSEESIKINSSEEISLTNDFKKNESSTDTDFHMIENFTEIHEVNETLVNETIVSDNSSDVICPKGYSCIPLNQASHEVCLSLFHIYILSGSIALFLVVALAAIFLKLRCRKNSSSLYDIPHLNIKSDYNLTPIPRPSITHPEREYPSFGSETYSRPRGDESVLNQRHFNSVPDEFMESKSVPQKSKLHTFGRSGSKKSEANSSCNEYYSLDTWKDKEPLRKQGVENLGFRKW